jgi:hypothetical protein
MQVLTVKNLLLADLESLTDVLRNLNLKKNEHSMMLLQDRETMDLEENLKLRISKKEKKKKKEVERPILTSLMTLPSMVERQTLTSLMSLP